MFSCLCVNGKCGYVGNAHKCCHQYRNSFFDSNHFCFSLHTHLFLSSPGPAGPKKRQPPCDCHPKEEIERPRQLRNDFSCFFWQAVISVTPLFIFRPIIPEPDAKGKWKFQFFHFSAPKQGNIPSPRFLASLPLHFSSVSCIIWHKFGGPRRQLLRGGSYAPCH